MKDFLLTLVIYSCFKMSNMFFMRLILRDQLNEDIVNARHKLLEGN
jgi:hypothetical protein